MEKGRRAARNNDSKLFAFSERGIGSDVLRHFVDKDDVFSGDHPTQNGRERLLLQRRSATQKEADVETSVYAIKSGESGRGRYRSRSRNVQEVVQTEQRETNKVRRVSRNHERVGEERVHGRRENEFETKSRGGVNRDR